VEVDGYITGMLVDRVTEVISLSQSESEAQDKTNEQSKSYVEGMSTTNKGTLTLIDVKKLFVAKKLSGVIGF
jgi:chemotaxis signal transduction protein